MTGEHPYFSPVSTFSKPVFPSYRFRPGRRTRSPIANIMSNDLLIEVFQDMQHAIRSLNHSVKNGRRHSGDDFQPLLSSLQSRLLHLASQLDNPFSELTRLAMLAFLSSMMNFPAVNFRATHLETRLEYLWTVLDNKQHSQEHFALKFWITMVAAAPLPGFCDRWLSERFVATVRESLPTWQLARKRLLDIMWVESIHDASGETAFQRLFLTQASQEILTTSFSPEKFAFSFCRDTVAS